MPDFFASVKIAEVQQGLDPHLLDLKVIMLDVNVLVIGQFYVEVIFFAIEIVLNPNDFLEVNDTVRLRLDILGALGCWAYRLFVVVAKKSAEGVKAKVS